MRLFACESESVYVHDYVYAALQISFDFIVYVLIFYLTCLFSAPPILHH